jgi:hypothetical protein
MIEHGHHTIDDIHALTYVDFCMYVDSIYNKKMRELEEQEEAMKNQRRGTVI